MDLPNPFLCKVQFFFSGLTAGPTYRPLVRHSNADTPLLLQCFTVITTTDKIWWICIQYVSAPPVFDRIRTDEHWWTCIQDVSASPVFHSDHIHWLELVNMHPVCECLSNVWQDQNHWPELVNMHPGCECLSSVWQHQIHWWELLNMHPECECFSSAWQDQIPWRERVNVPSACECLSSVSPDQTSDENVWTSRQWVLLHNFRIPNH